jgi:hypothetical protein
MGEEEGGTLTFVLRPLRSRLKKRIFPPQISNKIFKKYKISYQSRRSFLLPQFVKNLLRLRSVIMVGVRKDIL